jgi:hypothetical protein
LRCCDPVRVNALEGLGAHRTGLDLSRARGVSKFAGRSDDMAACETALEHGSAGRGPIVGGVAEAGREKSRMCFEFVERCADPRWRCTKRTRRIAEQGLSALWARANTEVERR